jgi:hypothetical protein
VAKHDRITGLPIIQKGDCPAGGFHDDAPYHYGLPGEQAGTSVRFLFCRKCKFIHFVEVREEDYKELKTEDENPLFDGLPHVEGG